MSRCLTFVFFPPDRDAGRDRPPLGRHHSGRCVAGLRGVSLCTEPRLCSLRLLDWIRTLESARGEGRRWDPFDLALFAHHGSPYSTHTYIHTQSQTNTRTNTQRHSYPSLLSSSISILAACLTPQYCIMKGCRQAQALWCIKKRQESWLPHIFSLQPGFLCGVTWKHKGYTIYLPFITRMQLTSSSLSFHCFSFLNI